MWRQLILALIFAASVPLLSGLWLLVSAPHKSETTKHDFVQLSSTQPFQLSRFPLTDISCIPDLEETIIVKNLPDGDAEISFSHMLHLLRLLDASGTKNKSTYQGSLFKLLTNSNAEATIHRPAAFLQTRWGIRAKIGRDTLYGEQHVDQCLSTFAELGVTLDESVSIDSLHYTVRDLLNDSIANFDLDQPEIEWTAVAYASYLAPVTRVWRNRFGAEFSFDDLTASLMHRDLSKQSCAGLHILNSMAVIAQVNDAYGVLSPYIRDQLSRRLTLLVEGASQTQLSEGAWALDWFEPDSSSYNSMYRAPISGRIGRLLATGHLLETMLLLPNSRQIPESQIKAGVAWLQQELLLLSSAECCDRFCPAIHGCIVLASYCRE